MFSSALTAVRGLVFPPICEGCECLLPATQSETVCEVCAASIRELPQPTCTLCARHWAAGGKCPFCDLLKVAYDTVYAAFLYEGPLQTIIQAYKFGRRKAVASFLAGRFCTFAQERLKGEHYDSIVAIPADRAKISERGFNPAGHFAAALSKSLRIPDESSWLKARISRDQIELSREQRRQNVRGKFYIRGNAHPFSGQSVLVVDDVLTTGSTISECAWVLQAAGASRISAICLARGPWQ